MPLLVSSEAVFFGVFSGPVVQLVERYNGIVEVKGSTPFRSNSLIKN